MGLIRNLWFKIKYWWYTWRIEDFDTSIVHIPYEDEDGKSQLQTITMAGHTFKTFMYVALTLEMDPKWDEDHVDALATFMVQYPEDVTSDILRAFLHPEFYESSEDEE